MFINQNRSKEDKYFMRLALQQAKKNLGNTKTNPSVGCVIVKNGTILSLGATSFNGRPHAECNAIRSSKFNLKNSNLYSTLEPCSHYGKTPPCINQIVKKKIKKVFFSINDPDHRSFNKCHKHLSKKGIRVKKDILSEEVNIFYRSYIKSKNSNIPFITCKLAISRDFYTVSKKNRWITNKFSRGRVHLLRAYHDCILTSSQTIIDDNPRLTCRIQGLNERSPARVILDKNLNVPINSKIFKDSKKYSTFIFYNRNNYKKIHSLKKLNIKTFKIPLNDEGNLDLIQTLNKIKKLGFNRVLIESGIKLIKNFLKGNLIDDFILFISSCNLKKVGQNNFKNYINFFLKKKENFEEKVNLFGDKMISYKLK